MGEDKDVDDDTEQANILFDKQPKLLKHERLLFLMDQDWTGRWWMQIFYSHKALTGEFPNTDYRVCHSVGVRDTGLVIPTTAMFSFFTLNAQSV